ncbi:MAG: hypothetical protein QW707_07180 [Candidatus Bathyarchaeia archaeon]
MRYRKMITLTIDKRVLMKLDDFCKKYEFGNKSRFVEFALEFCIEFFEKLIREEIEIVPVSAKKE